MTQPKQGTTLPSQATWMRVPRRGSRRRVVLTLMVAGWTAFLPIPPAGSTDGPRIVAHLVPPSTVYEARGFGEDPPGPASGDLTYFWEGRDLECGTLFRFPDTFDPRIAEWYHGGDPSFTDHPCGEHTTPAHPGTIQLDVYQLGVLTYTCVYDQGSLSGESHCEDVGEEPPQSSGGKRVVDDDKAQCPTAPYTKIQDAVNDSAANPGKDAIHVCAGTYRENVMIGPGNLLDIKGDGVGMTTVNPVPGTSGPAFGAHDAGKVDITGLTVDGRGMMAADPSGHAWGISYAGTDGTIRDVEVLNINEAANGVLGVGISVLPNDEPLVKIKDTLIENFTYAGIVGMGEGVQIYVDDTKIIGPPDPRMGFVGGIKLAGGATGTVNETGVWRLHTDPPGGGVGIYLNGAEDARAGKSRIWDVDVGIRLENTRDASIEDNWVSGVTRYGAELVQGGDGHLQGNEVTRNWFYDVHHDGAVVRGSNSSLISGNRFTGNWFERVEDCGISLFHGTETVVRQNWFKGIGVHAMHVAGANFNAFVGNTARDVGGNGVSMETGGWNHFTKNTIRDAEENGVLSQDGWNYFTKNSIAGSGESGIRATADAEDNRYEKNKIKASGGFDAWDESTGTGTAGTASTWVKNQCGTSMPPGLCKSKK